MRFIERIIELNKTINKDNIFAPPISDREALMFIKDYLLGEDWYSYNPIHYEQINTEMVFEILMKYSKRFRKEYYNHMYPTFKDKLRKFLYGR